MNTGAGTGAGPKVGFIGIGSMGLPMAAGLLDAGFDLTVFNRSPEKCAPLEERGASVAGSPAEVAATVDVVITMLSDGDAVENVFAGDGGIVEGAGNREKATPLLWIEMSTVGPDKSRDLAERASSRGVEWLDAPVSGSVTVAEAGKLSVMAGGEQAAFDRAEAVLRAFSSNRTLLGPAGSGSAMKLAVNLLIASTSHALSEALVLAESAGIAREDAYGVIEAGAVSSPFVKYKRAAFLDPDGEPVAFSLDLMRKDLRLATELGERSQIPMLSARSSSDAMKLAAELTGGGSDLVRVADALRIVAAGAETEDETEPRTEGING